MSRKRVYTRQCWEYGNVVTYGGGSYVYAEADEDGGASFVYPLSAVGV